VALAHILVFAVFALLVAWAVPQRARGWLLLASSVLAIYALQPSTPVRNLDFWLPTASLALTALVWAVTRPVEEGSQLRGGLARGDLLSAAVLGAVPLALGLTRYLDALCCLTPTRPPDLLRVAGAIGMGALLAASPLWIGGKRSRLIPAVIGLILALFVTLKYPPLALSASRWLRQASGQPPDLATALDLPWLGFSYLAFRLLHILRDAQAGKLPPLGLGEFATYALFFSTYPAGPIDRAPRYVGDLRRIIYDPQAARPASDLLAERSEKFKDLVAGSQRILVGAFKKFALADSLALIALNEQNAAQATSSFWTWILLYAYAWRIYFDFSGYTDIALGLGRLVGFRLPENFDRPYTRTNLTAFWNSWHITLAQWFRAYVFNPLTRFLRTRPTPLPTWLVILAGQMSIMLLIGLWHGLTWNFAAWGAWHGVGLFAHNRWNDWIRSHGTRLEADRPRQARLLRLGGWCLTFHYVVLGWVWFALPTPALAARVFQLLFGI